MNINPNNVNGILSSWDEILADYKENIYEDFGESKDAHSLTLLIKYLQVLSNSDNPLRKLFLEHVADTTNPHNFSLNISELQMFELMYNEYVAHFGVRMTLTEFTTAIIHVKRFATRTDVDAATNLEDAVNLDILTYSIDQHNTDPEAHANLMRYKFPGTPLTITPTIAIIPNIAMGNVNLEVVRNGSLFIFDKDGRLLERGTDTLAVDYSYGIPTIPIFSKTVNNVLYSEKPALSFNGTASLPASNLSIYTPYDNKNYHLIQEIAADSVHTVELNLGSSSITEARTLSFLYFPLIRSKLKVELFDQTSSIIVEGIFDVRSTSSEIDGATDVIFSSEILKLPNNRSRCSLTVKKPNISATKAVISLLDENDEVLYVGNGQTVGGLWQFQFVDKPSAAPVILTTDSPGTLQATQLSKNIASAYNTFSGTFSVKAIVPLSELYGTAFEMVHLAGEFDYIANIGSDGLTNTSMKIETKNTYGEVLTYILSEPYDADTPNLAKQAVCSYTYGHQSYGFTDNVPHMFDYYNITTNGPSVYTKDENDLAMIEYFTQIAGTPPFSHTAPVFLQLTTDTAAPSDSVLPLESRPDDIDQSYMLPYDPTRLYLGYSPITGVYLEGYLLEFTYYPVFSNLMNIEFLLDQYQEA